MRIKDLCPDERPREKLRLRGAKALSNAELLAILLGSGTGGKNVLEVAQELMKSAGGRLNLLGAMPLRELNLAILLGDVNALSRAPGIGKKTAQRIALELKDRISQADISAHADEGIPAAASSVFVNADSASEAVEALIALGYSSTEARNAVSQVRDKADTPEELIRLALRAMAGM